MISIARFRVGLALALTGLSILSPAQTLQLKGKFENGYLEERPVGIFKSEYLLDYTKVEEGLIAPVHQSFNLAVPVTSAPQLYFLLANYDRDFQHYSDPVRYVWLSPGLATLSLYEVRGGKFHTFYKGEHQAENDFLEQLNRIFQESVQAYNEYRYNAAEAADPSAYFKKLDSIQRQLTLQLDGFAIQHKSLTEFAKVMNLEIDYFADRYKLAFLQQQVMYASVSTDANEGIDSVEQLQILQHVQNRIKTSPDKALTSYHYRQLVNDYFYVHHLQRQRVAPEDYYTYDTDLSDSIVYQAFYESINSIFEARPREREFVLTNFIDQEIKYITSSYASGYTVKGCELLLANLKRDFPGNMYYNALSQRLETAREELREQLAALGQDGDLFDSLDMDSTYDEGDFVATSYLYDNDEAPAFSLHDEKGRIVSSGKYKGKYTVVFVNNSATSYPCELQQQLSYMKYMETMLKKKRVTFLYVELASREDWPQENNATLQSILKTLGSKGKYLEARGVQGAKFKADYNLSDYTFSFLIDRDGKYHNGEYSCQPNIIEMVTSGK